MLTTAGTERSTAATSACWTEAMLDGAGALPGPPPVHAAKIGRRRRTERTDAPLV
jgi:hypothetical protein